MLTIKPLRAEDVAGARRLSDAAGWNQLEVDWERLIALWPATTLGGWREGRLIATASLAYFSPLPGGSLYFGWVGVILVDPEERGAGHGGRIFDAAMMCGADRGMVDYGLDATEMGRPLYVKRGFADRLGMNRWLCAAPRAGKAAAAGAAGLRAISERDWDQVMALDQRATGVNRGMLLRRLAKETGVETLVAECGGKICGYGMLRPGRVAAYIGPVVAGDVAAGRAIFDGLMAAHQNAAAGILVDVGAGSAIEAHLAASGFVVARKLMRMGKASTECKLAYGEQVFAIAGLELC